MRGGDGWKKEWGGGRWLFHREETGRNEWLGIVLRAIEKGVWLWMDGKAG